MYGGRGIVQIFSINSKNSIHHLLNSTILPESEISFISACKTFLSFTLKKIFFPGFSFFQG